MYINQFTSYLALDIKLFFREPMVLFFAFVLPAFMYLVFGFMFKDMTYGENGVSFYDQYTASFIGIVLLNVAIFNIGPGLAIYRERGFFRRLVLTPLNVNVIYGATTMRALLIFIGGMAEIVFIGWLLFDSTPPAHVLQITLALAISAFSLFSFGFLFGALFKTSNAAFGASIVLFQVMMMLSGAGIPLSEFPELLQSLTNLVLFKHVVDLLRISWGGGLYSLEALTPLVVVMLSGIACVFLSNKVFRFSSK